MKLELDLKNHTLLFKQDEYMFLVDMADMTKNFANFMEWRHKIMAKPWMNDDVEFKFLTALSEYFFHNQDTALNLAREVSFKNQKHCGHQEHLH